MCTAGLLCCWRYVCHLLFLLYQPHLLTHSPTDPLTHPLTHPLIHSPTCSLTHSLTYSLTHPLTHSLIHSLTHSLTHPLTHPPTHSLTHSPTHPLTHPLTHSPTHSLNYCFNPSSLYHTQVWLYLVLCSDRATAQLAVKDTRAVDQNPLSVYAHTPSPHHALITRTLESSVRTLALQQAAPVWLVAATTLLDMYRFVRTMFGA